MPLLVTDAILLHSFDYLESSRIYRLATRDAGLKSVLARGARGSRKRFGSAIGLFAGGTAQISMKDGRDLQTLTSFDVIATRPSLAADYARFLAACALAELMLRFSSTETGHALYESLLSSLDIIGAAESGSVSGAAVASLWHMVAEMGLGASTIYCASCHQTVLLEEDARFNLRAGGILCRSCAQARSGGRLLPARARSSIAAWIDGSVSGVEDLSGADVRAHARLLREFVAEHLADGRELSAFSMWEGAL
jgi:DNA repair protein RecO (recombination protein O)